MSTNYLREKRDIRMVQGSGSDTQSYLDPQGLKRIFRSPGVNHDCP